jgi:branched-chain amino acid transport system substrate-binding protein
MMMRLWRNALAAVLLAASVGPVAAAGSQDLNIGFIGTLSGANANQAQDHLDGFKLGVKHLGGRLGGAEFDLTVFDDKHDIDAARQAMGRLLHDERAQVVLVSSDVKASAALVPLAAASGAFLLSLSAPAPNLAGKDCSPFFFSLAGLSETMHELSGQYLQAQGYRRVTIAGPDNAPEHAAAVAFQRGFKGTVTEVLSRRGEMAFDGDLRRIRETAPDAVYLLHSGGMAVSFIRQFADAKLKGELPLFGPGATFDQTVLAASGPSALDLFSVAPWSDDIDSPANKRMMSDFEGEYGRPPSANAAQGYDAAMLLDAAIRSIDRKFNDDDGLRGALRKVEFPSTRGAFRFDTNQFPIQSYLVRQAVRDQRGHMASEQRGMLVRDVRDGHAGECSMRWQPEPPPRG